jgi:hypothetical protein
MMGTTRRKLIIFLAVLVLLALFILVEVGLLILERSSPSLVGLGTTTRIEATRM